jgi:hypothetical protein
VLPIHCWILFNLLTWPILMGSSAQMSYVPSIKSFWNMDNAQRNLLHSMLSCFHMIFPLLGIHGLCVSTTFFTRIQVRYYSKSHLFQQNSYSYTCLCTFHRRSCMLYKLLPHLNYQAPWKWEMNIFLCLDSCVLAFKPSCFKWLINNLNYMNNLQKISPLSVWEDFKHIL